MKVKILLFMFSTLMNCSSMYEKKEESNIQSNQNKSRLKSIQDYYNIFKKNDIQWFSMSNVLIKHGFNSISLNLNLCLVYDCNYKDNPIITSYIVGYYDETQFILYKIDDMNIHILKKINLEEYIMNCMNILWNQYNININNRAYCKVRDSIIIDIRNYKDDSFDNLRNFCMDINSTNIVLRIDESQYNQIHNSVKLDDQKYKYLYISNKKYVSPVSIIN